MKVMLAEDSTPLRGIIRQMLAGLGFDEIVEAGDGQEAWEQLEQESFDLLLTDWNMPRMSGLELLQKVRASDQLKKLPVVMLTTRNNKEDIISALKAGVNNYVTKPCKSADLQEKIEKAILQQATKEKKKTSFERVIRGSRKYQPGQSGPVVVCFETQGEMEGLEKGTNKAVEIYGNAMCDAIDAANNSYPGIELGYFIEHDTKEIMKLATDSDQLVRLLLISVRDDTGVSLVRRVRHSHECTAPMLVVCDAFLGLEETQREAVARCGAEILERGELDVESLAGLIKTHLIPPLKKGEDGLRYMEIIKGEGDQPEEGSKVSFKVTGMLENGEVFEDCRRGGDPREFEVGGGQVVPGLEQGVCTMRVGGRSVFFVPPKLGYPAGDEDLGIPALATVVYVVELLQASAPEKVV